MFHIYATASHGGQVDICEAQSLMDTRLLIDAINQVEETVSSDAGGDKTKSNEQEIWEAYCQSHVVEFGAGQNMDDWILPIRC